MDTPANKMAKFALDRLLGYARALAYPDKEESARRGPYGTMQAVAVTLDGLQAAVVDYDKILQIIEQDQAQPPKRSSP